MATPGQLISRLSEVLNIPERTVTVYDRVLREAGLLSKAGRGRGSVHRSPLDTARLIIALLCTSAPARAAEAVLDFGALEYSEMEAVPPSPLDLEKLCGEPFGGTHTFEDAVTAIVAGFGRVEFREMLEANTNKNPNANPAWDNDIGIMVYDTNFTAEINVQGHWYKYQHPDLLDSFEAKSLHSEGDDKLAYRTVLEKYRGIPSVRRIAMPMIKPIAEFIAGDQTGPAA